MSLSQPQMVSQLDNLSQYAESLVPNSVRVLLENESNMQIIFHTNTDSDGKIKITFAIQESDTANPIYTENELEQAKDNDKFLPESLNDWEMKRNIRNSCRSGILNPRNRLLLFSSFIFDPNTNELVFSIFDAIKNKGIAKEFIGIRIADFARQIGIKFVTASVNPRNYLFFQKVGWQTLDQLDSDIVEKLFPGKHFTPQYLFENAILFINEDIRDTVIAK
jgi:hypothetical protein